MTHHQEMVVPDLGIEEVLVTVSLWLVPAGREVIEGDRVVELVAGEVTVDVLAPATGVLIERRVEEDEPVEAGQVLGLVACEKEPTQ